MNLADILNTNPQEKPSAKSLLANIFARNMSAGNSASRKEILTDYLTKRLFFNCSQTFSISSKINYSEYQKTLE